MLYFILINLLVVINPARGALLWVGNSGTEKLSHLSKVTQLLVALGFEPRSSVPREPAVIMFFNVPWGQLSLFTMAYQIMAE